MVVSEPAALLRRLAVIPAGAELDGYVAEIVCGWTRVHTAHYAGLPVLCGVPAHGGGLQPVPRYSRSLDAVWPLYESYVRPYRTVLAAALTDDGGPWWHVQQFDPDGFFDSVAEGESAPLAICRALLRTLLDTPTAHGRGSA